MPIGTSQRGAMLLLVAAAASLAGAREPESARLRYGIRPETSYDQTLGMTYGVTLRVEGREAGSATGNTTLERMGKGLKQELALKMSFQTTPKAADGTIPIECTLREAHAKVTLNDNTRDVTSLDKLIGKTLARGRVDASSSKVELEMEPVEANTGLPPDFKDRLALIMPPLPDRALKVGDSFEVPLSMVLSGTPMGEDQKIASTVLYTLKSLSKKQAVFDVRQSLALPNPGRTAGKIAYSLEGGATGTAIFDRVESMFSSVHLDMAVNLSATTMAAIGVATTPSPDGQPPSPQPRSLVMRATVEGPIDFTMSRASAPSTAP